MKMIIGGFLLAAAILWLNSTASEGFRYDFLKKMGAREGGSASLYSRH